MQDPISVGGEVGVQVLAVEGPVHEAMKDFKYGRDALEAAGSA